MPQVATRKPSKVKAPSMPLIEEQPKKPVLVVDVNWGDLPVAEAQILYAKLRAALERAGAILNARTTRDDGKWVCFMADKKCPDEKGNLTLPSDCLSRGKVHTELPKSTDNSYVNPKTGLIEMVRICSERCHIRWERFKSEARKAKYAPKREE